MKASGKYNFVGNVEASYLFTGKAADVFVCDGFVGNTVLKMAEGLYRINQSLGCNGNPFWSAMNYENVGGTPVSMRPWSSATAARRRWRSRT